MDLGHTQNGKSTQNGKMPEKQEAPAGAPETGEGKKSLTGKFKLFEPEREGLCSNFELNYLSKKRINYYFNFLIN